MNKLLTIIVCFLLIIKETHSGPITLAACCATCCAAHVFIPIIEAAGAVACVPTCIASAGTLPPECGFCAAGLLSPTP